MDNILSVSISAIQTLLEVQEKAQTDQTQHLGKIQDLIENMSNITKSDTFAEKVMSIFNNTPTPGTFSDTTIEFTPEYTISLLAQTESCKDVY